MHSFYIKTLDGKWLIMNWNWDTAAGSQQTFARAVAFHKPNLYHTCMCSTVMVDVAVGIERAVYWCSQDQLSGLGIHSCTVWPAMGLW